MSRQNEKLLSITPKCIEFFKEATEPARLMLEREWKELCMIET